MNLRALHLGFALGCFFIPANVYGQNDPVPYAPIERLKPPKVAPLPSTERKGRKPPEDPSETQWDEDLQRLRQRRKEREQKDSLPEPTWKERLSKSLDQEEKRNLPRIFMIEVSGVLSRVKTHAPTRDYTSELTSHFNLFWRPVQSRPVTQVNFWTGVRVAPFAGSGFYQDRPGRYGLTYFGPILAVGQLSPPKEERASVKGAPTPLSPDHLTTSHGWIVSIGVAGLSRIGVSEDPRPVSAGNDFTSSKGNRLDGSGLWMEVRYLSTRFGGISLNPIMGFQSGRYRQFGYVGMGLAGWY
jgi:hypothetical protein